MTETCFKKVLMVSWAYYPRAAIGAHRAGKFVKYMRDYGWEPTVLTVSEKNYPVIDENLKKQIPEGIAVCRAYDLSIKSFGRIFREILRRIGLIRYNDRKAIDTEIKRGNLVTWLEIPDTAGWLPMGLIKGIRLARKNDLIWATSPPNGGLCLAALLSRISGKPLIVDLRDPWRVECVRPCPTKLHRKIDDMWEKFVFKIAKKIIVVTDYIKDIYSNKYPLYKNKIILLYNGYDETDLPEQVQPSKLSDKDVLKVGYLGTLFLGRYDAMESFLKGTSIALEEKVVNKCVEIYFHGPDPQCFNELARITRTENIVHSGDPIPHKAAIDLMCQMDVLLLPVSQQNPQAIAGKMFEYIGSLRPVFSIGVPGATSDFIDKNQIGVCARTGDVDSVKAAWRKLLENYNYYIENVETISKQFTRKSLTGKLVDIFNETLL